CIKAGEHRHRVDGGEPIPGSRAANTHTADALRGRLRGQMDEPCHWQSPVRGQRLRAGCSETRWGNLNDAHSWHANATSPGSLTLLRPRSSERVRSVSSSTRSFHG